MPESPAAMPSHTPKDPLHGVTLESLLTHLVTTHGWAVLGRQALITLSAANAAGLLGPAAELAPVADVASHKAQAAHGDQAGDVK